MGIYKDAVTFCDTQYFKNYSPSEEQRQAAIKRVLSLDVRRTKAQEPAAKISTWTKIRHFLGLL